MILTERLAEGSDRAIPGHWVGELILSLGSSAIGTLMERSTRYTMLLHLPRLPVHGKENRAKDGHTMTSHGGEAVSEVINVTIANLPDHLRRSATWDRGSEMSQHAQLRIDSALQIYFCAPQSPEVGTFYWTVLAPDIVNPGREERFSIQL